MNGLARSRAEEERLARHLVYGGYPGVWLDDAPEVILAGLVEAVILRDASDLFRIGRPDAFRRMLRLAAGQAGNLVNLSEWASILGISRDTVASYLEILEASHVVAMVPPFAGGRRSELTKTPKIFFIDNGVRNHLVHSFEPAGRRVDAGPTMENWVFGGSARPSPSNTTSTTGAAHRKPRSTSSSTPARASLPWRSKRAPARDPRFPARPGASSTPTARTGC